MTATLRFLPPPADIFASTAEALTVPVNCTGAMGAGLANAFAHRFPWLVPMYQRDCRSDIYHPGQAYLYGPPSPEYPSIICAATKDDWRQDSRLEWVEDCMVDIKALCLHHGLPSVAIPGLGCGYGGLKPSDVRPIMERVGLEMVERGISVEVYEAHPARPQRAGRRRR